MILKLLNKYDINKYIEVKNWKGNNNMKNSKISVFNFSIGGDTFLKVMLNEDYIYYSDS